jgi:hypothetical protein
MITSPRLDLVVLELSFGVSVPNRFQLFQRASLTTFINLEHAGLDLS